MIRVQCIACGHEYRAEMGSTRTPCPVCSDSPTTEFPVPLDLWESWEDPDVVEE